MTRQKVRALGLETSQQQPGNRCLLWKKSPRKWVWCLLLWIAQVSREKTVFSNWLAGGCRRLLAIKRHAVLHQKPSCDWSLEVCHNHLPPTPKHSPAFSFWHFFQFMNTHPFLSWWPEVAEGVADLCDWGCRFFLVSEICSSVVWRL